MAKQETAKKTEPTWSAPKEPARKSLPNAANDKLLVNLREGDKNQSKGNIRD